LLIETFRSITVTQRTATATRKALRSPRRKTTRTASTTSDHNTIR
jgi:hypothetical protein